MLFKGTPERDAVEINDEIENLGGNINAYTTYDHTVYHMVLPSRHWREGMDIFFDMMLNSEFDEDEFEVEQAVILEEIREGDDSLDSYLGDRFFEDFYGDHSYGRPIYGTEESVERFSLENIQGFFSRTYRPENMVLAVSGDVEWHALVDAVRDLTADWSGKKSSLPKIPSLPEERKAVATLVSRGQEERILEIAFPGPSVFHEDVPALEVLNVVLGGGETSRLYRELRIKRELTRSIMTSLFVPFQAGAIQIHVLPFEKSEKEVVQEVVRQLQKVKKGTISGKELKRAQLTLEKDMIFNNETVDGRAKTLGYFQLTYGSFEEEEKYRNRILSVSREDIQGVCQRYFDFSKMSVALLVPKGEALPSSDQVQQWIVEVAGE